MVKLSPKILAHQEKATTTISSPEDVVESVLYTSSPPPFPLVQWVRIQVDLNGTSYAPAYP